MPAPRSAVRRARRQRPSYAGRVSGPHVFRVRARGPGVRGGGVMTPSGGVLAAKPKLDVSRIRRDFPILERKVHGQRLVYLDNAATTQKPEQVIEALSRFYRTSNANIHRGLHTLAEEATALFEGTRKAVARFIGGADPRGVVFTRNATEALNLVAYAWGRRNIQRGDEILLTEMEHHSNLVPWIILAQEKGAV